MTTVRVNHRIGQLAAEVVVMGRSGRTTVSAGKSYASGRATVGKQRSKNCVKCQETCMDDITRIQRYFAQKAQARPAYRFREMYSLIWKPSFLETGLNCVLTNQGSRSAGIDGISAAKFKDPEYRAQFIHTLSDQLKTHAFKPSPGKRVYIAKVHGKQRPLGILTIQDRVVQMVLKMLLEPIFEMDFLFWSYGFRPGRRTMDCIIPVWWHTSATKHFWIVEGDIRSCFDNVHHQILDGLLRKRIADRKVLNLIQAFLKAGVMDGKLFRPTAVGTQQGGILSPLLANVYLHQFDQWWWKNYGSLTRYQKQRRRNNGLGQPLLYRFADDWVLLWSGKKADAALLKTAAETFFQRELKLELNPSKTRITHIEDGFTFLGFDIKRYPGTHGKPVVLVKPGQQNIRQLKAKIKALTTRKTTYQPTWYKVLQLNRILKGWSAYYQYVNAKITFGKLDWWVLNRVFGWARKKHGNPAWRTITAKYRHRDSKGRINFVCHLLDGSPIWLYRMADRPIRRYQPRKHRVTYAQGVIQINGELPSNPLREPIQYPAKERDQLRLNAKRRDNFTCQKCYMSNTHLHIHHIVPKSQGGKDTLDNLTTLCPECHSGTHRKLILNNVASANTNGKP